MDVDHADYVSELLVSWSLVDWISKLSMGCSMMNVNCVEQMITDMLLCGFFSSG